MKPYFWTLAISAGASILSPRCALRAQRLDARQSSGVEAVKPKTLSDTVLSLPIRFSDIAKLFQRFSVPERSEFETAAEYRNRLAQRVGFNRDDVYAIRINPVQHTPYTYDADKKRFETYLHIARAYTGIDDLRIPHHELWGIVLDARIRSKSRYAATNAFGAKTVVTRTEYFYHTIWNDSIFPGSPAGAIAFELAPEVARRAKPNLQTMILFAPALHPDGWVITRGYNASEPTFNAPQDDRTQSDGMWTGFLQIVVYDSKSGRVYLRKTLHQ